MATSSGTHNYIYDNIYQFKSVDYPAGYVFADTTFNFDIVGNRISTLNGGTTNYTSNSLNQYTQVGEAGYSYDANGNLTSDGISTYIYDYENRLSQATKPRVTSAYTYDPFGRRIQKNVGGTVTKFLYDGDQLIAEYDGSGTLIAKYVYGSGIDEPIRMEKGGQSYYYHFDGLGSVTNLTDSSGATVESYSYDAFGKPSVVSSIGNRFMFTGREYDSEVELYYYRSRYYSPTVGRFLQRDPVGYSAGINLYTYCSNNPINWIDPFGWDKQGNKGNFPGGFMIPPKTTPDDPRPEDPSPPEPTKEPWWKPDPGFGERFWKQFYKDRLPVISWLSPLPLPLPTGLVVSGAVTGAEKGLENLAYREATRNFTSFSGTRNFAYVSGYCPGYLTLGKFIGKVSGVLTVAGFFSDIGTMVESAIFTWRNQK